MGQVAAFNIVGRPLTGGSGGCGSQARNLNATSIVSEIKAVAKVIVKLGCAHHTHKTDIRSISGFSSSRVVI